jgi:NAD(P)-dependent dehydrogenase (short-subunit alcohol dehydrogenase family)
MTEFKGKTAVVTGGASGIGRSLASRFLAEGMNVVIADIDEGPLSETAVQLGCVGVRTDVSDPESVASLAAQTIDRFGSVHLVCNNAGVGAFGRIADLTLADWKWMINVNLWGVIHGVHYFLPRLLSNPDGGWIVNTASMGGVSTYPALGAYATCKFGVTALTETLSQELEEAGALVGATVLLPGPITSNLGSSTRNRPDELKGALVCRELNELPQYKEKLPMKEPSVAADAVMHALRHGDLYAVTHPEQFDRVERRVTRLAKAFNHSAAFSRIDAG